MYSYPGQYSIHDIPPDSIGPPGQLVVMIISMVPLSPLSTIKGVSETNNALCVV